MTQRAQPHSAAAHEHAKQRLRMPTPINSRELRSRTRPGRRTGDSTIMSSDVQRARTTVAPVHFPVPLLVHAQDEEQLPPNRGTSDRTGELLLCCCVAVSPRCAAPLPLLLFPAPCPRGVPTVPCALRRRLLVGACWTLGHNDSTHRGQRHPFRMRTSVTGERRVTAQRRRVHPQQSLEPTRPPLLRRAEGSVGRVRDGELRMQEERQSYEAWSVAPTHSTPVPTATTAESGGGRTAPGTGTHQRRTEQLATTSEAGTEDRRVSSGCDRRNHRV